ncbi:DUF6081 family protein [Streptomyces sp. NPDC057456]|uniref:DUF6081 family protein n=1 Tax=Streptomyces sp. NPDC057456 TaxID=3346139 RepID=UPI0036A72A99
MTLTRRTKSLAVSIAAAAVAVLLPWNASARTDDTEQNTVLLQDDFSAGFTTSGTGAKWNPPAAADGTVTTSSAGLKVVPPGTNPTTGQPAFTSTTGQQSAGGLGTWDHLKWAAMLKHTASSGVDGFDTPSSGNLSCSTTLASVGYGMKQQPFGSAVSDPDADPRLGSGVMLFTDQESGVIFDFFVTNKKIYAVYERRRTSDTQTYAAYSYAVPVASRSSSGEQDTLKISYNRALGKVTWSVDGASVLTVSAVGKRSLDRSYMTLDHGGTEGTVAPRQLDCGLGTFTLLDGAMGTEPRGLVRIDSAIDYYVPRLVAPTRQTFVDETSRASDRLWGQGVELDVDCITVTQD